MRRQRWLKPVAAVFALSLVAAACGDDDDDDGAADTTAAAATTAAPATTGGSADTTAAPETTAAATEQYGQSPDDPNLFIGTSDFQLDLADCPSDYDPQQGITDDEILVFSSMPFSGPLAGFGLISDGAKNYFDYVNANGGIGGRNIVMETKDDTYDPAKTATNVSEAVQAAKYAAMAIIIGTPNNLAVWDQLNEECMPQMLNGTGAAQWGDVENHPWTTGMQIDYVTEAKIWTQWIKSEFPNGAKIGAITFNSDFGKSYSKGLRLGLEEVGDTYELVKEEFHDPTAPNLTNQVTTVLAENPDVVLIQTSGAFCVQAMSELEKAGYYDKGKVMISGTCGSIGQFFKPMIDQGLTGNGTYIIQYVKDPFDPAFTNEDFIQLYLEQTEAAGLDPKQTTYFTGWLFAHYFVEILKLADSLNGGLSRPNMIIANRMINIKHPAIIAGNSIMDGTKDAYLNESGRIAQYGGAGNGATGVFTPVEGQEYDAEGQLGTYATVESVVIE